MCKGCEAERRRSQAPQPLQIRTNLMSKVGTCSPGAMVSRQMGQLVSWLVVSSSNLCTMCTFLFSACNKLFVPSNKKLMMKREKKLEP